MRQVTSAHPFKDTPHMAGGRTFGSRSHLHICDVVTVVFMGVYYPYIKYVRRGQSSPGSLTGFHPVNIYFCFICQSPGIRTFNLKAMPTYNLPLHFIRNKLYDMLICNDMLKLNFTDISYMTQGGNAVLIKAKLKKKQYFLCIEVYTNRGGETSWCDNWNWNFK